MRPLVSLLWLLPNPFLALANEPEDAPLPRVHVSTKGFVTVKEAIPADPKLVRSSTTEATPGFLGIALIADKAGKVIIEDIATDSPADTVGLKAGLIVLKFNGEAVRGVEKLKDTLRGVNSGETVKFTVSTTEGKVSEVEIVAKPASKTMAISASARAVIGITSGEARKDGGVEVSAVTDGGAAQKAGVKVGDIVMKIDETELKNDVGIRDVLATKKPGDVVRLTLLRGKDTLDLRAFLQADNTTPQGGASRLASWDDRLPSAWKKPTYKLAIIGVDYPDVKHNDKIKDEDWEASMFSINSYKDKSATGQRVYGSMADYYREISYGKFNVEGKFVGWTEVSKKRTEYSSGSGTSTREKTALLIEAMDKLLEKNGKDYLKDYDGVFFIYAGERVNTTRGGLYWPHRASVTHNGKRWPYFIVQEGGSRMNDISVFCHEFGHMLGLPDLYARPEVPGMEGVGPWCAMSQQNGQGRPQHFSAWSKDQLGWVQPKAIDPRVKQKIVLSPIEDDPTECLKVIVRADGSEYFLIENRKKKGFDAELPAEGLLIWRVLPNNSTQRVFLEEAHGVGGPTGPRQFLGAVPYPAPGNNAFTPSTTPSSKSQLGGGFDVYITNIRKLPDGRMTFQIGTEFQ